MMLLFAILPVVCVASSGRCNVIPPSLWCSNDELSRECDFEDYCNRYHTATHNQQINITVLIEALCPDCQQWIVEELYPHVFKNFMHFVNIEFLPFGNAKMVNGTIKCQHGPEECLINRFESCVIECVQTQDQYVPLIYCIENQMMSKVPFDKASAKCFRTLSVSDDVQRQIQSCLVSRLGEKLQEKAAQRTANVWPEKHTHVPWIVVNGVSLEKGQMMMNHLPYLLCDWYNGDKKIPFCQAEEKKRHKMWSWNF